IDTLIESRDVSFALTNSLLAASIFGVEVDTLTGIELAQLTGGASANTIDASGFYTIVASTPLALLNHGAGANLTANDLKITLTDGKTVSVDLTGAKTIDDVLNAIEAASPQLSAGINAGHNGIDV